MGVGSARAVFSELVNRLFQAVRVETVSPEDFLSGSVAFLSGVATKKTLGIIYLCSH